MDFTVDLFYLCIFFPLWTCLLIICCSTFLSFESKKITTLFSILSSLFTLLFSLSASLTNFVYENAFPFISINEINIDFGTSVNRLNSVLLSIFSFFTLIAIILTYKKYRDNKNFNKNLLAINALILLSLGFFMSPNLMQMCIFYISFSTIFYCLENLKNQEHERAKNFLVINRLGDITLFSVIGGLFYYNVFFGFQNGTSVLEIKDLDFLFAGIQSVCETQLVLLFAFLLIISILIKSVLVFIHPLISKIDVLLLSALSITSGAYWFILFLPEFSIFEYFKIAVILLSVIFVISAAITVYMKLFCHDEILKINNTGTLFIKNLYLKFAKGVEFIDKCIFDKLYEYVSKTAMKISGCFQFPITKTTLYALIFNILGIGFLILAAWFIYNFTMKG